ncbi:MAG: hypothetical protein RQ753_05055 [Desulfurivibrionaceae bacterium]|nr:hypothetical protein [Desulfurivibrionaceae bacterium]
MSDKVCRLENGSAAGIAREPENVRGDVALLEPGEDFGKWLREGALLQKTAAVCFILVFALLLRTVTDYGYINVAAGSFLGLAYVSILAGIGCVFYGTGRRMANVFSISGFLLLFTIVIEGHERFGTISTGIAHAILMTALVTAAFVGIKYRVAGLLAVSVIGVAVTGMAVDFPRIIFPLSGLLLLTANVVAFLASEHSVSGKLKWPVTLLTMLFMALWAFKAAVPLGRREPVAGHVYLDWLAPFLVAFVGLYLVFYTGRYFKKVTPTVYDVVLPSFNVLLFFGAGGVAIRDYWQQPFLLGLISLAMALGHLALGWRLLTRTPGNSVGMGGVFVAGTVGIIVAVPVLVGNVAWAIPVWALMAFGLAWLSGRSGHGFIRLLSYLYPVLALLTGVVFDIYRLERTISLPASLAAAASLALVGLLQYDWCRRHPPPRPSLLADFDGRDRLAGLLLLVGLAGSYLLLGMLIDSAAPLLPVDPGNVMQCGRSIVINIGVIFLLILAGRRHDLELVWVAVFLAIVGCLKVFLADLFTAGGIPLVLSVLSYGLAAMTGSVVMGRWNKREAIAGGRSI